MSSSAYCTTKSSSLHPRPEVHTSTREFSKSIIIIIYNITQHMRSVIIIIYMHTNSNMFIRVHVISSNTTKGCNSSWYIFMTVCRRIFPIPQQKSSIVIGRKADFLLFFSVLMMWFRDRKFRNSAVVKVLFCRVCKNISWVMCFLM